MHGGLDFISQQRALRRLDILEGMVALIKLGVACTHITIWRAAPTGHQMIFRSIDSNPVQPRIKGAVTAKVAKRTIGFYKSLLGNILSLMGIMHKTHDQTENLVLVFQHQ
ncbi:hypothetical protein ACG10_05495 [Azotobacter chroococcum]|nr:hypothetical protein ACG10_05495 [Azotobacter chroococcum]